MDATARAANAALTPPAMPAPAAPRLRIAALLPLTGPNAALGQAMLQAAQLALNTPGAPALDARDTGGTPAGAIRAAQNAVAGGDTLIIGPLTSAETGAAASVAQAAHVPVLAFTSNPAQARPGVWTLGLTPAQQVRRLVGAARQEGKTRFAALLPRTVFGDALADGYRDAVGSPPPDIRRYDGGIDRATPVLNDLAQMAQRRPAPAVSATPAPISAAPDAAAPASNSMPLTPPPFDVLLLAESGERLQALIPALLPALAQDGVTGGAVRILGPALWAKDTAHLSALAGAWYAAPDPKLRARFNHAYYARYGATPPLLSDLAYDAASLGRVLAAGPGFTSQALTQPEGFAGVDGVIALLPDGHVRRGLALFELGHGTARIVQPSPSALTDPGV